MNSSMFTNCSVFCDVRHGQSSILGQYVMFRSVRSLVLLLCDQTYSLMFMNCSVFCDVRHVRSSILDQNVMFGKFDVRTFNVQSVWSSVFWCSFTNISVTNSKWSYSLFYKVLLLKLGTQLECIIWITFFNCCIFKKNK